MKVYEQGILIESNIYFHTPSEQAKNLFLHLICTGHYVCDSTYAVKRNRYDSFLLLYVIKGSGYVYQAEERKTLTKGSLLLLDCYQSHAYGTLEGWEIIWAHFDGKMARPYYEAIAKEGSFIVEQGVYSPHHSLQKIYNLFHETSTVKEPLVNKYLTNLLTDFFSSPHETEQANSHKIDELLAYINEHIQEPLPLETLAERVCLSPYYFIRTFKQETGYTPHEYVILTRVNAAKFYLRTTTLPIKEVVYRCGFSSECSFWTTFKKYTTHTPLAYRNMTEPL